MGENTGLQENRKRKVTMLDFWDKIKIPDKGPNSRDQVTLPIEQGDGMQEKIKRLKLFKSE